LQDVRRGNYARNAGSNSIRTVTKVERVGEKREGDADCNEAADTTSQQRNARAAKPED
jgi:hypothetical protein